MMTRVLKKQTQKKGMTPQNLQAKPQSVLLNQTVSIYCIPTTLSDITLSTNYTKESPYHQGDDDLIGRTRK